MTRLEFESKMLKAQTFRKLGKRPDYWAGFIRGLRRRYHGENFGTSEEHELWMRLAADAGGDESRHERGIGYRDGFLRAEDAH